MELIFFLGSIQAYFWVILILNKRGKQLPDLILGSWMFIVGINLFLVYINLTPYDYRYWPYAMGINAGIPNLHGPFLLLYIQSQSGKIKELKWAHLLHLIPATLTYLLLIKQFMMSKDELISWIENAPINAPLNLIINEYLVLFTGIGYITWSWIELRRHQLKITRFFSDKEKVDLHWLRNLIIGLAIIWLVVLFSEYLFYILRWPFDGLVDGNMLIYTAASIFVFYIGINGIRQGDVFTSVDSSQKKPLEKKNTKYLKSGLKKESKKEIKKNLEECFSLEKPYLESGLTLRVLADKLEVPQNHLSQVINEELNSNFYELINKYRIEEFKLRVESDVNKTKTILGHALESGFSSKSSFNDVFKKFENMTPSEYLKTKK